MKKIKTALVPLSIIKGEYNSILEYEGIVCDIVSDIIVNSKDFPELEGLRNHRVLESEITPMNLANSACSLLDDLCALCEEKSLKQVALTIEILEDGRASLEFNVITNDSVDNTLSLNWVSLEPIKVKVEYNFSLKRCN